MSNYFAEETVDDEANLWNCTACGKSQMVAYNRKTYLNEAPIFLKITLLRFETTKIIDPDTKKPKAIKNKSHLKVDIPQTINLKEFMTDNQSNIYELESIVLHEGQNCELGHYYTIISETSNVWKLFNDHNVSIFEIIKVLTSL